MRALMHYSYPYNYISKRACLTRLLAFQNLSAFESTQKGNKGKQSLRPGDQARQAREMMVLQPATDDQRQYQRVIMKGTSRKRRSKGTIAGFALPETGGDYAETSSKPQAASSQPQHATDTSPGPSKPCHYSRLALLCVQNSIKMGARTQLHLCPPGRARRELHALLRHPSRANRKMLIQDPVGGYYGLDKMIGSDVLDEYETLEEEFLLSANTFEEDSDEEASTGDDDDLCDFDEFFSEESPALDDEERYSNMREPLYTPIGSESALTGQAGVQMEAVGPHSGGKLPFNRRKLRYFDAVTSTESTAARKYLEGEVKKSKHRAVVLLSRHLRKIQREEKRRKRLESGESTADIDREIAAEAEEEKSLLEDGVSKIMTKMSPPLAAALLVESLKINPLESLEGMAKCYDGIVTAGVALLDAQTVDPTAPPSADAKPRPTRSEIMAALAPLLITSLEHSSGEVILMLAKLRRLCGTARYQRRFVQRVAPCLIRPPRGAMWCLRHQNDMEAILAAAELIFDSAFDIFSKGWHERGQLLLADSKRAQTLNSAAAQLRRLSSEPADGIVLGLSTHGARRRLMSTSKMKAQDGSAEPLAEWEVITVDKQIRISISNLMKLDWSKTSLQADVPRPFYRKYATGPAKRSTIPQATTAEISPKSIASSPRSPMRTTTAKAPQSPPQMPAVASVSPDNMENVFGPAFTVQPTAERAITPPPTGLRPTSPIRYNRSTSRDSETKSEGDDVSTATPATSSNAPPRSPKSPLRPQQDVFRQADTSVVLSPMTVKVGGRETMSSIAQITQSPVTSTPLSPSSVGTTGSGEIVTYRPSTTASGSSSVATAASHYRMLTSTAAERKRTVAACRALRAQIQRFEEAFISLHGRPPKGNAERAPLATTYAQYREWKRAIRTDAACRIQALIRGALTRSRLCRSGDGNMLRIVMNKAGRAGYTASQNVMSRISLPVDIGQGDQDRSVAISATSSDGMSASSQPLAPQWAAEVVRRRSNSGDRNAGDAFPRSPLPRSLPPPSSSANTITQAELRGMSLTELQARKRDLKKELKRYDMDFARSHGRLPVKAEKEPIRHLYESYNALKSQISSLEQETRLAAVAAPPSPVPQRSSPPSSGSDSSESPARASPLPARSRRRVPNAMSPPISSPPPTTSAAPGNPMQDLAALKVEKTQLHQMLRSYERDFFREHRRQVSSFADIQPVASQYRRYKEIKKAIAALQKGES